MCTLQRFGVVAAFAFAGCQASDYPPSGSTHVFGQPRLNAAPLGDGDENDDGDEARISADSIPQVVKDAALAALPGLVIQEAELEEAGKIYCVHGTVDGKFHEVEVSADGATAHVEDDDGDDEGVGDDD